MKLAIYVYLFLKKIWRILYESIIYTKFFLLQYSIKSNISIHEFHKPPRILHAIKWNSTKNVTVTNLSLNASENVALGMYFTNKITSLVKLVYISFYFYNCNMSSFDSTQQLVQWTTFNLLKYEPCLIFSRNTRCLKIYK